MLFSTYLLRRAGLFGSGFVCFANSFLVHWLHKCFFMTACLFSGEGLTQLAAVFNGSLQVIK